MSYDFFVWSGPAVANADAAFKLIETVEERDDVTALDATPRFIAFLDALFREHPPLDAVGSADTVWSCTDDRSDRHALLSIQAASAQHVVERILSLCTEHGLRAFDPQTGDLFPADAASSRTPRSGVAREIIGSTATPTELFWFVFTKFRNDRDISGHFLGQSAAAVAKALQSDAGPPVVREMAMLLYLAADDDCDLDSIVSEEIHGDTAVVTVVPRANRSFRRQVHMRRIGRAWKIYFPEQA